MALLRSDKQDFLLNLQTGDLDLTGGKLNISSSITGVAQGALIRVKMIKGEWFLNRTTGVPYFVFTGVTTEQQALLGTKYNGPRFELALRSVLETSPGVSRVLLLNVNENKKLRRVTSKWQLQTVFGDTPIQTLEH